MAKSKNKPETLGPNFKTFYSKNNLPFRLSGINETHATIFWLDTLKYETFEYYKIQPYLK